MKDVLSSATMEYGAQSVMTFGMHLMPGSCADSWDTHTI